MVLLVPALICCLASENEWEGIPFLFLKGFCTLLVLLLPQCYIEPTCENGRVFYMKTF